MDVVATATLFKGMFDFYDSAPPPQKKPRTYTQIRANVIYPGDNVKVNDRQI